MIHLPGLSFDLGDDIQALRELVQHFTATEITPRAHTIDRSDQFPQDLWRKLGQLGLHGLTVPEHEGGTDLGYLAHIVAMEELSRGSAAVGLSYGAHSNLCINQIYRHAPTALRARAAAVLYLIVNLIAFAGIPLAGAVTDYVFGDPNRVNLSLAAITVVFEAIAVALVVWGLPHFRRQMEAVSRR